ncbi:MAG: double zinc ribbon domain-containing protein [Candidatus Binatia bacterium]
MSPLRKLGTAFLLFLYPQRCLGCRSFIDPHESFCQTCQRSIQPIKSPLCICCGIPFTTPLGPDHLCGDCLAELPPFRRARAWVYYHNNGDKTVPQPISSAVQQFKYQRNLSVGQSLARLAAPYFPLRGEPYDLIVPVPLHLSRLRWRGFNQSLLLAHAIGQGYNIPVDPFSLIRTRSTLPQTQLKAKERQGNVHDAFAIATPRYIEGKRVLLVDDVYTSGATVTECTKTLLSAGSQVVDVFTLARAVG